MEANANSSPKFLFLELTGELIGIDLEQLLLQPVPGAAPIRFKMNLLKEKRLVGLKHATLGSTIYLLGGEKLRRGAIPTMSYLQNHMDSYLGPSPQVFDLRCRSFSFRVELSCTIPPLNHPKGSPMVAHIDGKIYVLQGKPYLHVLPTTGATFEAYHPSRETWEVLPCPPPYERNRDIFGHFVLGHKLFVVGESQKVHFFDTRTCTWETGPKVESSFMQARLLPPTNGVCVPFFPQLNNDQFQLMLSRDATNAEVHALVMNSSTGQLLCHQTLNEVISGILCVPLSMQSHFFFVLPERKVCAVLAGSDQHKRLRLFVSVFALNLRFKSAIEFLPAHAGSLFPFCPVERRFLEVRILHKRDCTVTKEEIFPAYVHDAFLL